MEKYRENPERICKYGHGRLDLQPQHVGIPGAFILGHPVGSGGDQVPPGREAFRDAQLYVVQLWRCKACGSLELVDRE